MSTTGASGSANHSAAATIHTITYVAIGASDSFGVGTMDPVDQSWPANLARLLGTHVRLMDLGLPGVTAAQAAQSELPVALASQPRVVTIWLGVNDLAKGVPLSQFSATLTTMITELHTRTHAAIYVANLPDLTYLPYFAHENRTDLRAQVRAWNAAIATICAQTGATLVDLDAFSQVLATSPEYISADGLHPSAEGAYQIAKVFANSMLQLHPFAQRDR